MAGTDSYGNTDASYVDAAATLAQLREKAKKLRTAIAEKRQGIHVEVCSLKNGALGVSFEGSALGRGVFKMGSRKLRVLMRDDVRQLVLPLLDSGVLDDESDE